MNVFVNNIEVLCFNTYGLGKEDIISAVDSRLSTEKLKEGEMVILKSETSMEHFYFGDSALYYWRDQKLVEKYPSLF